MKMMDVQTLLPPHICTCVFKKTLRLYPILLLAFSLIFGLVIVFSVGGLPELNIIDAVQNSLGLDFTKNGMGLFSSQDLSNYETCFLGILSSGVGLGLSRVNKETAIKNDAFENIDFTNSNHPNLPDFLLKVDSIISSMPDIQSIRWSGVNWQESWREFPKFLLYSAHFDGREGISNSYVRIIALYDGKMTPKTYSCQYWFNETTPAYLMIVHHYDLIDYQGFHSNYLIPYMISCYVPVVDGQLKVPIAVSLVNNTCDPPSNVLQVNGLSSTVTYWSESDIVNTKNDLSIGVCGPALYYYNEDFSRRLIEWIEILKLFGVSKIILYKTVNHKNVEKVLQYYEDKGIVTTIPFHYPPPYVDEPSLRRLWTLKKRNEIFSLENIYFTDCILRFKDDYDYLAHFDPDEIPIMKEHKTLSELIQHLRRQDKEEQSPAFYHLKWKVFYSDNPVMEDSKNISDFTYILRHTKRPKNIISFVENNGKSIYNTNQVLAVFSHKPLFYVNNKDKHEEYVVNPSVAYLGHFRDKNCSSACENVEMVEESFILDLHHKVLNKVISVLRDLDWPKKKT